MAARALASSLVWLMLATSLPAKATANASTSAARTPSTMDAFLMSALKDFKVTLQEKNEKQFGVAGAVSLVEQVQLRVAQNETISDRKFTIRVKPRDDSETRAMRSLESGLAHSESLKTRQALSAALVERYLAATNYLKAFENQRLWSSIATLRSKRLSMLQAAARSSTSRAMDLISQREKVEESEVSQGLAAADLRVATARLKALDPDIESLSGMTDEIPRPVEMLKVVGATSTSSLAAEIAFDEAKRATASFNADKAKDQRLIEFLEVSYDQFQYGKQYGFRVAFNLPSLTGTDPSRSEQARKLATYEIAARKAERADTLLQTEARESLARAADLYKSMTDLENRPEEKRMRRLLGQQDPLLAVTIQEDGLKRELRKVEVSSRALESYFGFLASSGALAENPKTNFLTRNLRELAL